jgi:predicted transcriptional regulator
MEEEIKERKIASRGIPSKEVLWFPPIEKWKNIDEKWRLEDIVQFIYPKEYQKKYNEITIKFLDFLLKKPMGVNGTEVSEWIKNNKVSKATFYNIIVPHLVDIGIIKRRRIYGEKGRKTILMTSEIFSNFLKKLSETWLEILKENKEK